MPSEIAGTNKPQLGLGSREYYLNDYGSRAPSHYAWLLSDIITNGSPGHILDLGCGTGLFVELSTQWGIPTTGLEGSPDAISLAKSRNSQITVHQGTLGDLLPFPSNSFHNILLNQVIEHLSEGDFLNLLTEIKRIIHPTGRLFIYSPSKANREEVLKDPTHINPLLPSELRQKLHNSGFTVLAEPNTPRFTFRLSFLNSLMRRLLKSPFQDLFSGSTNARAKVTRNA